MTDGTASILHADLDAFYASVEQRDDPSLRGRPVIVGSGVVLAASYEARAFGVYTPMNGRAAREACPQAIVVEPRMHAYTEASREVFEIFDDTTPLVEGLSIDEAFLDVSGMRRLAGSPAAIAGRLRDRVRDEVGLSLTVGVARTKFLAKVASGVAKPDGLLVVEPDAEMAFLHPLPVGRLWGVGPVTERRLAARGIHTVSDVAALDPRALRGIVGDAHGHHLNALAHNRDPRPVEVGRRRASVGSQRALGRSAKSRETLEAMLLGIVDRVCARLRSGDRVGRTGVVRFRDSEMDKHTRSHTVPEATATTSVWQGVARDLFAEAHEVVTGGGRTFSLIGFTIANLSRADAVQATLPFGARDTSTLDGTIDELSDRFGAGVIQRASLLGQDEGISVPILPDPGER